jgi:periplasmic protein TonB
METMQVSSKAVTLEEMIFENRNRAYGAYFLRNHKAKYLIIAFLITILAVSSTIIVPFINAVNNFGKVVVLDFQTHCGPIPIVPKDFIKPPVAPSIPTPPAPTSIIRQSVYTVPKIGNNETPDNQLPTMNSLNTIVNRPVNIDTNNYGNTASDPAIDFSPDPIVFAPAEPASFKDGDLNTFREWVQVNIVYPQIDIENGIEGRLFVEFCINKKGEIVEIKVLNNIDPSLEKETLRVLKSAPRWRPAKQGGYEVKQQFHMPVIFKLNS